MTNEEKDLLVAYLVDAGEIDTDGDVEQQFLDWYQVRDQVASGEAHYKAILEAARGKAAWPRAGGGRGFSLTVRAPGRLPTTALPAVATPKGTLPAWPRATPNAATIPWKT